jgi:hypothetical protein
MPAQTTPAQTNLFLLDDEEWLKLRARRYRESGAQALAEELRRLPWHAGTQVS